MSSLKKNNSGKRLSKIMVKSYLDNYENAREGAFVVWIAAIFPAEILMGFDNLVYFVPESFDATMAAKGFGTMLSEKAEKLGFSMDLCSYPRIDMGSSLGKGESSLAGTLPIPNLLISNNNNCSLLVKWFDVYHREWNVPHFILDVPFCYTEQKKEDLTFILRQYHDLIRTIEKMSGQRYDKERVCKAARRNQEAKKHWKRFIGMAAHRPSGITAFDSFVHMAGFLTLRGTPELENHCKRLADETEERIEEGIFPVPEEKYRLLWDSIAPWHQLKKMQQRLAGLKANIIAASYTYCIGSLEGEFDPVENNEGDPLWCFARSQNFSICAHGMHLRRKAMTEAIRRFDIDGVVFASNKSCKPYSLMQMGQQKYISETLGVKTIMVDVDHADARNYNENNVFLRIEALLENIESQL